MYTGFVSVINWVKKAAKQIKEESTKRSTKTDILGLYEMCVNLKNILLRAAVDRKSEELIVFEIKMRDTSHFENL